MLTTLSAPIPHLGTPFAWAILTGPAHLRTRRPPPRPTNRTLSDPTRSSILQRRLTTLPPPVPSTRDPHRPPKARPNPTNFAPQLDTLCTRFPTPSARCIALYAIEGLAATWVLKNAKTTAYPEYSEPYRPLWPTCQLAHQNRPAA